MSPASWRACPACGPSPSAAPGPRGRTARTATGTFEIGGWGGGVFNGGTVAVAACQAAHAVLAAGGQWVTNEKTLLDRAGLRGVDGILAGLAPDAGRLARAVDEAEALLQAAVTQAGIDVPA